MSSVPPLKPPLHAAGGTVAGGAVMDCGCRARSRRKAGGCMTDGILSCNCLYTITVRAEAPIAVSRLYSLGTPTWTGSLYLYNPHWDSDECGIIVSAARSPAEVRNARSTQACAEAPAVEAVERLLDIYCSLVQQNQCLVAVGPYLKCVSLTVK